RFRLVRRIANVGQVLEPTHYNGTSLPRKEGRFMRPNSLNGCCQPVKLPFSSNSLAHDCPSPSFDSVVSQVASVLARNKHGSDCAVAPAGRKRSDSAQAFSPCQAGRSAKKAVKGEVTESPQVMA